MSKVFFVLNKSRIITHAKWLTFFSHSHLEALFEPAVLALVPVVLINGAAPATPTLVREVPPD